MLRNNTVNKIISLIIAIILWAFVMYSINPPATKVIRDVPITFINQESLAASGLAISSDNDYKVDIVLDGLRTNISKISLEDLEVTADLNGFSKGLNTISVKVAVPKGAESAEARPDTVQVMIEEITSINKPVEIVFKGDFDKDKEIGGMKISPEEISVSGPQSKVESVSKVIANMDPAKLDTEDRSYKLTAIPVDSKGREIEGLDLSQEDVTVTAYLASLKTVPLDVEVIGEVDPAYHVESVSIPEEVTIKGGADALKSIERLKADDVDISGINLSKTIPLNINLPKGVELSEKSKGVSLEINLEGISNKELEFKGTDVEINGLSAGYTANISTALIKVTIYGREDVVSQFTNKDLKLYVNLEKIDLDRISLEVPLSYRYNKDISKIESKPEKIHINIKEEG